MELNFQQSSLLSLLEKQLDEWDSMMTGVDGKVQTNLNVISIIVSIGTVLNLNQAPISRERAIVIGAVVVVYCGILLISYLTINPRIWPVALNPLWSEVKQASEMSENDYYNWLLSTYLEVIKRRKAIVLQKSNLFTLSAILVGFDIVLVVFASIV